MGALVRYEKLDEKELSNMTAEEKRQVAIRDTATMRSIGNTLFNIFHYVKMISCTCDELKSF